MMQTKAEVLELLEKCEELKKSKFIVATTKIKDILKCIVNSQSLYALLYEVTEGYNYLEAKQQCFVHISDTVISKYYIRLPMDSKDCLAFIFCLFVEFDKEDINFNDFLRTYYSDAGSFYASFQVFCKEVIDSFENIITEVYSQVLTAPDNLQENGNEQTEIITDDQQKINIIKNLIENEKGIIFNSTLSNEDKDSGINILNQIINNLTNKDGNILVALLDGYNYFLLYAHLDVTYIDEIIENIANRY